MSCRKVISEIKWHVTTKLEISPCGRHPLVWNCFYCFKKKIKQQRQTGVKSRGYTVGYTVSGARMGRKYPGAREQLERL